MEERRLHQRRQLLFFPPIHIRSTDFQLGKAADLSQEGLLLVTAKPLELHVDFPLELRIEEGLYGSDKIRFTAKTTRCIRLEKNGGFHIGMKFTQIEDLDRLLIKRMIVDYKIS